MASISNGELGSSVRTKLNTMLELGINAQTGTTYTLLTTDHSKLVTLDNASDITVTVPAGLGGGGEFYCLLLQKGAGRVTVTGSGATVNSFDSMARTAGQYAVVTLYSIDTNVLILAGMLAT